MIIKMQRSELVDSKHPVLDTCRMLKDKTTKEDFLEVYRGDKMSIRANIHEAAELNVYEDPSPRFGKFKKMREKDKAALLLKGV